MTKYKVVGFTGTREGLTREQEKTLAKLLKLIHAEDFHHGDCKGADSQAATIAFGQNYFVVVHPPTDDKARAYWNAGGSSLVLPEKPYLERNHDIVDASDILLAAPHEGSEVLRSGTWATIRYAMKKRKPIIVVLPDGETRSENNAKV